MRARPRPRAGLAALPARPERRVSGARASVADEERRRAVEWRDILGASGPVFVAAGLYWTSRVDLLPAVLRRALAQLADPRFQPSPIPDPRQRLAEVGGRSPEALFARFDPRPFAASPFFEHFRAEPSEIVLVRPELDDAARALELLTLVAPALATWLVTPDPEAADELVESARRAVVAELDLDNLAEAFEALGREGGGREGGGHGWDIPRVHRELSNAEMLTLEARDWRPWVAARGLAEGRNPAAGARELSEGRESAESLCLAWLRQALLGCRLPAAPRLAGRSPGLALAPGGRWRVVGGGFVRPSPGWQDRLAVYLGAVETQDPDAILDALEALLDRPPADREAFRSRLRQLRPLREARDFAPVGRFASQLLLHWRWLAEEGARPELRTLAFFRGVGLLEQSLLALAPDFDPWPATLERLWLEAELVRWRQRLDPGHLGQELREGVALLTRLPRILDSAATALEGGLRLRLELPEEAARSLGVGPRESASRALPSLSLLFVVVLVAALLLDPSSLQLAAPSSDTVRGLFLLLIGLYLGARHR